MLLELREYERTLVPIKLDPQARDRLGAVARVAAEPAAGEAGSYYLTPTCWVGALPLGHDVIAVIKPKITISRLVFMLSYVLNPDHWDRTPLPLAETEDLVSAIVLAMAAHVETATRQGLLCGYTPQEEAAAVIRGRIRLNEQIKRRFGIMPPIEVTYDDFTENIAENLIPRAALHVLGRLHLSDYARLRLRQAVAPLRNVELHLYDPFQLPFVHFTRLTEHYRPLVELARFVLQNAAFEFEKGTVIGTSFMVDMNKLFEGFMFAVLRDALLRSTVTLDHGRAVQTLDIQGRVELIPDLSVWSGKRPIWIGDLKYKRPREDWVPNEDLYQVLSYLVATDLPRGTLIYPRVGPTPSGFTIRHVGKEIAIETVDLALEPKELLASIGQLGSRVAASVGLQLLG